MYDLLKAHPRAPAVCALFVSLMIFNAASDASVKFNRTEDFVVVSGADVAELSGAEVSDLRLYSCGLAACSAVPVQIDKVDDLGRYVFPQEMNDKRDGTGLDENDEIVFMAGDAGVRRDGFRPKAARNGVEIELIDPLDGSKAFLYLFEEPGTEPPKTADYVSYRIDGGDTLFESDRMVLGYPTGGMSYETLRLTRKSGGLSEDVLVKQRIGMEAVVGGDLNMPLKVPENLIKTNDIAVIDGPVRVIVDEVVVVKLGQLSFQWGNEYFLKIYRNGQHNSANIEFSGGLSSLFKTIIMYYSLDFEDDLIESNYLDDNHEEPVQTRAAISSGLEGDGDHNWWGVYTDDGAVLQALYPDRGTEKYFSCSARMSEGKGKNGGAVEIGFDCREKDEVPDQSDYHVSNYLLVPEDPSPEGLMAVRNIFLNPLEVRVNKLDSEQARHNFMPAPLVGKE